MTKEEQIALDAWRDAESVKLAGSSAHATLSERLASRYEEYRRLVRDDVRPPVVVDQLEQIWTMIDTLPAWQAKGIIRTYGDERFAEGERAGIERAAEWTREQGWSNLSLDMGYDLLGSN